ncbi:MAG: hypothetical protein H7Z43_00755 [Clostridia bacterium]|nr:hypothetical protein [Deltaproteobacteria bacterium]
MMLGIAIEGSAQPAPGDPAQEPGADETGNVEEPSADPSDQTSISVEAPRKNLTDPTTSALTRNVLLLREQSTRTKRFGLLATISTFVGSGTFITNDALRQQRDYVAQVFDFRPTYGFNIEGHRLRLQARIAFETEYTDPNTDTARRFKPYDASVAIADDTLFKWDRTGILFNSALRLTVPTSYESINVRQQWLGVTLSAGARRLVGPVQLSFNTAASRYLNGSKVAVRQTNYTRRGEATDNSASVPLSLDPVNLGFGPTTNAWLFGNTVSATWLVTDNLAVSASLGLLIFVKYAVTDAPDQYTSANADVGRGSSERFQSGLEISYDLTKKAKEGWNLPFGLTLALGAYAVHPVQQTDNSGWIAPVVANSFFSRAANNYGTIYLDVIGIY